MPTELTEIERMTLSTIAAFPIAIFEGPVVNRLIAKGMVSMVEGELRVTDAGRRELHGADRSPAIQREGEPPGAGGTRRGSPDARAKAVRRA